MSRRRRRTKQEQDCGREETLSIIGVFPPRWSETVSDMVDCIVRNPELVQRLEDAGFKAKNPEGMTYREVIIASQINNALKGDLQSYRAIMDSAEKDVESSPLLDFVKENFGE